MTARQEAARGRLELVDRAREIMRTNLHDPNLSLDDIVEKLYISRRHLQRAFNEAGSEGYRHELFQMRVEAGAILIKRHPERPIEQVAQAVGYLDPSQFAKSFRRRYKCSPRVWRTACRDQRRQAATQMAA